MEIVGVSSIFRSPIYFGKVRIPIFRGMILNNVGDALTQKFFWGKILIGAFVFLSLL